MVTLGTILKNIRKDKGLSQITAAQEIGITNSYLCHIEHDDKLPKLKMLKMICKYYGMNVEPLLQYYIE